MKKKISLMLAVIMLLQIILPIMTVIWESGFTIKSIATDTYAATVDGITWTYEIQDVKAINVKPKDKNTLPTEVIIPSTLNGYTVTSVGERAFQDCINLTSIEIPDGVTSIGDRAFFGCSNLKNVNIPKGVTTIWDCTFYNCKSLKNINIPISVTRIFNDAFTGCTSLTKIIIPNNEIAIWYDAFLYCNNLTIYCLKNSAAETYAKNNSIVYKSYEGTNIYDLSANQDVSIIGVLDSAGTLTISGTGAMKDWEFGYSPLSYSSVKKVIIKEGITSIGANTFYLCERLTEVIIPNSVTKLSGAFYECTALNMINIPKTVTTIESGEFLNCSNLTIYCEKGSYAEKYATEKGIPCETYLDAESKLYDLSPNEDGKVIGVLDSAGTLTISGTGAMKDWEFGYSPLSYSSVKKVIIKEGITSIGANTFYLCGYLTEVEMANSVTKLSGAFYDCATLKKITIPNSVKEISNSEFINCPNLTIYCKKGSKAYEFAIAKGIKYEIEKLSSIKVTTEPTNKNYIEGQNFNTNGMVVTAIYDDGTTRTVTGYTITGGNNLAVGKTSVTISYTEDGITKTTTQAIRVSKKALTGIEITQKPRKYTYLEYTDFESDGMLVQAKYNDGTTKMVTYSIVVLDGENLQLGQKSVTISYTEDGITKTTTQAITVKADGITTTVDGILWRYLEQDGEAVDVEPRDKSTLPSKVTIPDKLDGYTVTNIAKSAFSSCKSLTNITLPKGLKSIGTNAFQNCSSLTSIMIPKGVTSVGDCGFFHCISLTTIEVEEGNLSYISEDGVLFNKDKTEIISYPAKKEGREYIIPKGVTTIKPYAFSYSNLTNITIPNSVTSIEDHAFYYSSSLTNITIPKGIKSIGIGTFWGCSNLTSIEIPSSVTSIGISAFRTCTSLTSIEIPINVTSIGSAAFNGCSNLKNVAIPKEVTTIGSRIFEDVNINNLTIYCRSNSVAETYAKDNSLNYVIDDNAPIIRSVEKKPIEWTEGSLILNISAIDSVSGLSNEAYSFDGGKTWQAENTKEYTETTSGIVVKVKDSVGNEVTYEEEINITKIAKLTGIEITTEPRVIKYLVGQNFNSEGMVVTATYSDGTTAEVEEYTISPNRALTTEDKEITISYTEDGITKTTTQAITVVEKVLEEIEIRGFAGKTDYIEGQNFEIGGITVRAYYSGGLLTEYVTDYEIVDGEDLKVGQTSVTISYTKDGITKTATYPITVRAKELATIAVTKAPNKTVYVEGQNFNQEGMVVKAIYDNGTEEEITEGIICTPTTLNNVGTQEITVTYGEKTATFNVTVIRKGDVNNDSKVDFRDMLEINKHRLGKKQLTGVYLEVADVTGDGAVNFMDILQVNRYRLGKIDSL